MWFSSVPNYYFCYNFRTFQNSIMGGNFEFIVGGFIIRNYYSNFLKLHITILQVYFSDVVGPAEDAVMLMSANSTMPSTPVEGERFWDAGTIQADRISLPESTVKTEGDSPTWIIETAFAVDDFRSLLAEWEVMLGRAFLVLWKELICSAQSLAATLWGVRH